MAGGRGVRRTPSGDACRTPQEQEARAAGEEAEGG